MAPTVLRVKRRPQGQDSRAHADPDSASEALPCPWGQQVQSSLGPLPPLASATTSLTASEAVLVPSFPGPTFFSKPLTSPQPQTTLLRPRVLPLQDVRDCPPPMNSCPLRAGRVPTCPPGRVSVAMSPRHPDSVELCPMAFSGELSPCFLLKETYVRTSHASSEAHGPPMGPAHCLPLLLKQLTPKQASAPEGRAFSPKDSPRVSNAVSVETLKVGELCLWLAGL